MKMSEFQLNMAVKRRSELPRSVPDESSQTQNVSTLQSARLTDDMRNSQAFELVIRQTPKECRVAGKPENDKPAKASKWPLDPAPVVEFLFNDGDLSKTYLHSPFWFCSVALEPVPSSLANASSASSALSGCLVSSLHKVKMQDNMGECGLFIFGDLHAKIPGRFRLRFTLYELRSNSDQTFVANLATQISEPFTVHSGKSWPGQAESTSLSRHLCDCGVKLRIRKETSKRKAQSQDWASGKRAAVSSLTLPNPMGPPPSNRRISAGEDIGLDQISYGGGAGIKGAMDREQYANTLSHHRGGSASLREYPYNSFRSETYPSTTGSYSGQSSSPSDNRSNGMYQATAFASSQFSLANPFSTSGTSRPSVDMGYISAPQASMSLPAYSAGTISSYSMGNSRYPTSNGFMASSSDMDQYRLPNYLGGTSSVYGGRSLYPEPSTGYEDGRNERSLLLAESPGTNNIVPGWNSGALSTLESTRSS